MSVYSISYDLRKPGRNYENLIASLRHWGAVSYLESDWLLVSNASAEQIRDALLPLVDANDGVFVAALTGEAAWNKILCAGDVLKAKLNS